MKKIKKIGLWIAIILPAFAFAAAGTAKLMGVEQVLQSFPMMGLPSWFGAFIGACEVAGAIGLLIAPLRSLAASGLVIIMAGAVFFHVAYQVPSPIPAIVLSALLIVVIKANWDKAFWKTGKLIGV